MTVNTDELGTRRSPSSSVLVVVIIMNIQQLRYFCSVMRIGTFSGAARAEGVSVQAVSKALGALEEELGLPLFLRRSKGATATQFGREFDEYARAALAAFDGAGAFAKAQRGRMKSGDDTLSILLAIPSFHNHYAVCHGIERFLERQLGMEVSLGLCPGFEAIPRLLAHDLDALITVGEYTDPRCATVAIGSLPTGVFVSGKHPLAQRETVRMDELAGYPVCYAEGLDDFNETILKRYLSRGLRSPQVKIRSREEFAKLVADDHGFAFGVGVPSFSTIEDGKMLRLAPPDNLSVSVFAVTARDYRSARFLEFERFMLKEFPRVMKTFSLDV